MKEINSLVRFACILVVVTTQYILVIGAVKTARTAGGKAYTMAVCGPAHKINDGKSEKACGDAQDQYKLEFLCNSQGADAGCWVEEK
jgi:hypothetical protein